MKKTMKTIDVMVGQKNRMQVVKQDLAKQSKNQTRSGIVTPTQPVFAQTAQRMGERAPDQTFDSNYDRFGGLGACRTPVEFAKSSDYFSLNAY